MAKKITSWRAASERLVIAELVYREAAKTINKPRRYRASQDELMGVIDNVHQILLFTRQSLESNQNSRTSTNTGIHERARECGSRAAHLILTRYHPNAERRELLERWRAAISPESMPRPTEKVKT